MPKKPNHLRRTPTQRFWEKVNKTGPTESYCWLWTGSTNYRYGQLWVSGRNVLAHRFSYELHFGPVPRGKLLMHCCDTPGCVNPGHLFVGTQKDNLEDSSRKGRQFGKRTQRLTKKEIDEILRLAKTGVRQKKIAADYGISMRTVQRLVGAASTSVRGHR